MRQSDAEFPVVPASPGAPSGPGCNRPPGPASRPSPERPVRKATSASPSSDRSREATDPDRPWVRSSRARACADSRSDPRRQPDQVGRLELRHRVGGLRRRRHELRQQVALGLGELRPATPAAAPAAVVLRATAALRISCADHVLADAGPQRQAIRELIAGRGLRDRRGHGQHRVQEGEAAARRRRVVLLHRAIDEEVEIRLRVVDDRLIRLAAFLAHHQVGIAARPAAARR